MLGEQNGHRNKITNLNLKYCHNYTLNLKIDGDTDAHVDVFIYTKLLSDSVKIQQGCCSKTA